MEVHFKFRTVIYIVTSIAVLLVTTIICCLTGLAYYFGDLTDINYFDLLVGQIANTLIVLSLTSVLSSNFGQAYWIDIKESKLITPFWGCFIGITVYLLTALVFSVIAYAFGVQSGVVVSAVFSTVLLIILTFKMISIYFGKDELKKQLSVVYKHKLILNNTPYVSDYLRRLKIFEKEVGEKDFSGRTKYLRQIEKEIRTIENGLDSKEEKQVDLTHSIHIDKQIKCTEEVKGIDQKIVEYTKNAISNNETEIVKENIELLIDCENYNTFFNLLEELFDWDEKYTCKILRKMSKKNMAGVIKEKQNYFKKYALNKLITQSGKLDAIQDLLMIFDASNLGMSTLEPQINDINKKSAMLRKKEFENSKKICEASEDDFLNEVRKSRKANIEVEEEDVQLKNELLKVLQNASAKDLRTYYLPIRETCIAYDEGKYEIVNRYVAVILENYHQDVTFIRINSGIAEIKSPIQYTFSYVTDEEKKLINQLIEKDRSNMYIAEKDKDALSKMDKTTIDNDPWSNINSSTLEIYGSTFNMTKER